MPRDLPGFYFDAEKNRYFPIKGPIPGSSRHNSAAAAAQKPTIPDKKLQEGKGSNKTGIKISKLLHARELYGSVITSKKGKINFVEEYHKAHASRPTVWKYPGTERTGDGALEQIHVDINTASGAIGTDILLAGGFNGSLRFYDVDKFDRQYSFGLKCVPDRAWPLNTEKQAGLVELPCSLWRSLGDPIQMSSNISCIKMPREHSPLITDNASSNHNVLVTTLGSETSGGVVYSFSLKETMEYQRGMTRINRGIQVLTSFDCTVWTADCNSGGSHAVIGTNLGAALVNLETGAKSWICRCDSDILSVQIDDSHNIVLCGLRNGAIVTVDVREKSDRYSASLIGHRMCNPSYNADKPSSKRKFEIKANLHRPSMTSMPSSISCLALLNTYDQYFLGSSMDGSIMLYDHRMMRKGAVQSYVGNVNSHTRIQLGVDPSERFVMSGGEDFNLRLWNIKSGELLFEEKFMDSIPAVVCWPRRKENHEHSWEAWLGSQEGLYYMRCH